VQAPAVLAQNVVAAVKPDHPDHPETMDSPVKAEHPEAPDKLADHQFKHVNKLLHLHVIPAQPDHPDHLVPPEHPVMPDQTETLDKVAAIHKQAHPDQKDHLDHQDLMDNPVPPDNPAPQLNHKKQDRDKQDQPEMQDHQDHQDQPDNQDSRAAQEPQDQRDQMDNPEHPEMTDSLATPVKLVNLEALVRRVFARNTVPSTEESSSRMEHVDVKSRSQTRTRGDLPLTPCPMIQRFPFSLLVAQKTAIYYVSLVYFVGDWRRESSFGLSVSFRSFFLK